MLFRSDKVGGNWVFNSKTGHSSVYENTFLISSKAWSEFEDFPMPDDYPDYPSHLQMQRYFESYAQHFGFHAQIKFEHTVEHVERQSDGKWKVTYSHSGSVNDEIFDVLMVSNGHHNVPKYPEYPGSYTEIGRAHV